jgi:alkaline phosphatase
VLIALNGTIAQLREARADGAKLDPATQPERQKMIGVYEAAGFPRYQLAADGYPETLDVNGKMLIGFGGSADRYENWLTKAQPNLSVEGLPTDLRTEILGKGYLALPVDRDKDTGFFLRGQAQGQGLFILGKRRRN